MPETNIKHNVVKNPNWPKANQLATLYLQEWSRFSTQDNQQAGIHTSFHPFKEIGQIFHDKCMFNNHYDRTFRVEIWKMVWTKLMFSFSNF